MTIYLPLDVETIPTRDEEIRTMVYDGVKPPRTLKKVESIAKWHEEEKPAAVAAALDAMGLDGATAEIVTICFAINDGPVQKLYNRSEALLLSELIERVGHAMRRDYYDQPTERLLVIAHNAEFDLGMIRKRAMVHGLDRPTWFPWKFKRFDNSRVFCTMTEWDADPQRRISLDRLCRVLGVPSPKNGIDGSMIAALYAAGEIEKIANYCAGDVEALRACFWRMYDANVIT
jgi:predicted PolB exonuclease-like 3'-5' exonuclease